MGKEQEYKEIFLAEALESYESLNNLFTELEKDINNKKAIDAIFRITHTLKGNAMGMGFVEIAELGHVMEDVFNEVKSGKLVLDSSIFSSLYKANDILGELIAAISEPKQVKYKGIKTKLEVILRSVRGESPTKPAAAPTPPPASAPTTKPAEPAPVSEMPKVEIAPVVEAPKEQAKPTTIESPVIANSKPTETATEEEEEEEEDTPKISVSDVVQVPVRKLDALLNIVGELLIEKDSLLAKFTDLGHKASEFARLHRITSDLQYGVMDVRLVQMGFLFSKFHRVLRDVAVIEKKKVNLVLEGTEIEIDRNILKAISDAMVHMVRNSVSHGIEKPEVRVAKGKPETGTVTLNARNEKDTVFIDISDDGAGIDLTVIKRKALEKGLITQNYANIMTDDDVMMLLFEPGFSNAEQITEVSGRGVGMDVVKRAAESMGGKISVQTELGKGSTFTMALPSSMAVKGALLFELEKQEFAIPLSYTEAVLSLKKNEIHKVNSGLVATYLGRPISIMFLKDIYEKGHLRNITKENIFHTSFDQLTGDSKLDVVIVSYANHLVGLVVDKLVQQKEIVEKGLTSPVDKNNVFSGATILGNGNVCLVLDIVSILSSLYKEKTK